MDLVTPEDGQARAVERTRRTSAHQFVTEWLEREDQLLAELASLRTTNAVLRGEIARMVAEHVAEVNRLKEELRAARHRA